MKVSFAKTPDKDNTFVEIAIEMKSKFYLHWAILAGATLTLVIPFLTQISILNKAVNWMLQIKIAIGLLLISLITSSVRNLLSARQIEIIANNNLEKNSHRIEYFQIIDNVNQQGTILSLIEFTSIISYCVALTLLYLFIAFGLLA